MADGERHSPKYVTRSRKIKSINKKRMGLTDDNGVEMITTEASIYIRSMYGDLNTNIIEIKRPEGLVSVIPSPPSMDVTANVLGATRRLIHGVLGMINLSCGPVLIVATEIKLVTDNFLNRKHKVYNIVDVDIVPIWMHSLKNSLHSPSQITDDIEYVKLLRMAVTEGGVCFSKTFDLTRSLQNQTFEVNPDANFMFNGHAATPFLTVLSRNEQKAKNLIIGIGALILVAIEGLVEWNNGLSIGGDTLFSLGLVARRRIGRDGKK